MEKDIENNVLILKPLNVRFCPYCGNEIKPLEQWNGTHKDVVYECQCDDAIKARELLEQINRLRGKLPTPKYHIAEAVVKW